MTVLRDGSVVDDSRLDRLIQFDPRSRGFPVRALLAAPARPRSFTWACLIRLNQGREGACVGYSIAHEAASRPAVVADASSALALRVYRRAQQLDEWPDDTPYEGTSVLAGMKAASEPGLGWYSEYRWAFGLDDLILAVGLKGPAVLGINWYTGMMEVDSTGYVRVTGVAAGGHAILCNGVDVRRRRFRLTNSWGPGWGRDGQAWISFDDLDRLLHESGEACIPIGRHR